jgi:NAD(P)-dependent dehydrogenase (short-subunit alcohol dehydrogenase family)
VLLCSPRALARLITPITMKLTTLLFWLALPLLLSLIVDRLQPGFIVHSEGSIILSGASTGIGFAAAVALARKAPGLSILAGVRRGEDAERIRALGIQNLAAVFLDVTSPASIANAVRDAPKPIVGIVANAGLARGPTTIEFHELEEDALALFNVNLLGALRLTQAALPQLRESKGRAVYVSSIFGALAPPMGGVYAASKFALEAAADSLRREVGPLGVSVSIIRPGAVTTPIFSTLVNASLAAAVARGTPASRIYPHLHSPADLANEIKIEQLAASVDVTTQAILHALLDARPRTRYTVANICGVPATVLEFLAWALPTRALDFALSQKG